MLRFYALLRTKTTSLTRTLSAAVSVLLGTERG
jgi:hypothetical protein